MVRDLFQDKEQTEFIIATIPTVLGINESRRLLKALREDEIPCKRIIINQVTELANAEFAPGALAFDVSFLTALLDSLMFCMM